MNHLLKKKRKFISGLIDQRDILDKRCECHAEQATLKIIDFFINIKMKIQVQKK